MDRAKALGIFHQLESIDPNFHLSGSVRRGKEEDIHDLDVIYVGDRIPPIRGAAAYVQGPKVQRFILDGEQVDVYLVDEEHFGAMMLYLTGPQKYNIVMRAKAKYKGMLLNQYGLWTREEPRELIASRTEEDIYDAMGLAYKPPELRGIKK
jgi:DNA polymerase (family X)